jgi:hypothetical protein
MQEVFSLFEAQALQGHMLVATKDYQDEHDRTLIPHNGMCRVIGLDAGGMYEAGIALQYDGSAGGFPTVVLMNKTTYQEHFENVSLEPAVGD